MKTYVGNAHYDVFVCPARGTPLPLDPRHDLRDHSPDGFSWGYAGSGPAQLALALLADALGDDRKALAFYQDFKWMFVALIPGGVPWQTSDTAVQAMVRHIENQRLQASAEIPEDGR